MRQIIFDTETTGVDVADGHRIAEVGCVEVVNYVPTGRVFHRYVNPERDSEDGALRVHGLTTAFLSRYPSFGAIAEDLLAFLGESEIVAHNAEFDLRFLNAELALAGLPPWPAERVVDTLAIARRLFPGARNSLDRLCERFGVDNSGRELHGALKDAHLLAAVYLELMGGRQPDLALDPEAARAAAESGGGVPIKRRHRPARPHAATEAELAAHTKFLERLTDPIWHRSGSA